MDFQITNRLKISKSNHDYGNKYVQTYRSDISPNQIIWNQMFTKYRQKFAKPNMCSQTLPKFARFPESDSKFAYMATLNRGAAACLERYVQSKMHFPGVA